METSPSRPSARPPLLISRLDCERLESLIESQASTDTRELATELARADIIEPDRIPADVVTMNSTARFRDEDSGEERDITLVYPRDVGPGADHVSILAPIGSALLGLRIGDVIQWPLPGGRAANLRVLSISHQPEAAGELHR